MTFKECDNHDHHTIDILVAEVFKNYRNHYYSNPCFSKEKITEGYQEWAKSFIMNPERNKIAWIIFHKLEPVGLATFTLAGNICQGGLHGIRPEFSGRGFYS